MLNKSGAETSQKRKKVDFDKIKRIFFHTFIFCLLIIPFLLSIHLLLWGYLMESTWLIIFSCFGVYSFLPLINQNLFFRYTRITAIFIVIPLLFFLYHKPFYEVQDKLDLFSNKMHKSGFEAFDDSERFAICYTHLTVAFAGYLLGYPEAGKELLFMHLNSSGETKVWYSDFAMGSKKVRLQVDKWIAEIKKSKQDSIDFSPVRIAWPGSSYLTDEARVALALNPFYLSGAAKKNDYGWEMDLTAYMPVRYFGKSATKLIKIKNRWFIMEEGLFYSLQSGTTENPLLHVYDAFWKWSINIE